MAKIMVVDDEQEILALLDIFLKKKGFDVVQCRGGKLAVETIKTNSKIDLVVLDRRMPDLDGAVVLEEIRKIERTVPVIMLTGSLGEDTKQIPVDDFLMKPIDLHELLEKVQKLLENQM